MDIAFHIPVWLLWLFGIPAGICLLALAAVGAYFIWSFRDWSY